MSAFALAIHHDEPPLGRRSLERVAHSCQFRAPDGERVVQLDNADFAFARMEIAGDPPLGDQPLALDNRWWICAHARLYGREDLVARLRGRGAEASLQQPDAWLIVLAYREWGTDCLVHLNGDFSFALWDAAERELFCATDRFGIRPLFYQATSGGIRVANTISAFQAMAAGPLELDDLFIAEFLALELSLVPEATAFRDVRRLPHAHCLTMRANRMLRVQKYWDLPTPPLNLTLTPSATRDRFRELLQTAVRDRLPNGPVSFWLSGGMDSTSLAAIAAETGHRGLMSFTAGSLRLTSDPEPKLASAVAEWLRVPHEVMDNDPHLPFQDQPLSSAALSEPWHDPYRSRKLTQLRSVSAHSRVVIGGGGGDELLCPELSASLIGHVPLRRLLSDVGRHLLQYRRFPPMGVRPTLRKWRGIRPDYGPFMRPPAWINPDVAHAWRLTERLEYFFAKVDEPMEHWLRPMGANRLEWTARVTSGVNDPGTIQVPLETRKPFFDQRLVEFMYSIPPLYWCSRKAILREAMSGRLPPHIVQRPKTSVAGNLFWEHVSRHGSPWRRGFDAHADLSRYVDLKAVRELQDKARGPSNGPSITMMRDLLPISLNNWLASRSAVLSPVSTVV